MRSATFSVGLAALALAGCDALPGPDYARCAYVNEYLGAEPERDAESRAHYPNRLLVYRREVAMNCLAMRANALSMEEASRTEPDALLGACHDEVEYAADWAYAEHWGDGYEYTVAESLAVREQEVSRFRRRAAGLLLLNSGSHCSAFADQRLEDVERRARLEEMAEG